MSKNVQAESNVRQACLNGIAEAQPLFCKEHFISCFVFCSFVLPHNADELGAFVEVERINHVGAAVRPADGVVGGDAQDACCLVHLEVHTAQVLVIAAERHIEHVFIGDEAERIDRIGLSVSVWRLPPSRRAHRTGLRFPRSSSTLRRLAGLPPFLRWL